MFCVLYCLLSCMLQDDYGSPEHTAYVEDALKLGVTKETLQVLVNTATKDEMKPYIVSDGLERVACRRKTIIYSSPISQMSCNLYFHLSFTSYFT